MIVRKTAMRTRCLVGAMLFLGTTGAQAADAGAVDAADNANDIVVIGKSYGLDAGTKSVVPLKDIPNTVTVIDQERIQQQNLFTLEDLMTETPGITITGVGSEDPSYQSRGFPISNYLIDGVPNLNGGYPAVVPDIFLYDRVEVLRGPAGLFSGSGSPAGSINLVRKRPLDETRISASIGAGSWQNYRGSVDLSWCASDGVGVRLGAVYQDQDQFYDVAHRERFLGFGVVEAKVGDRTTITLGGHYDLFKPAIQTGLPGIIGDDKGNPGRLLDVRRSIYLGGAWNRFRSDSYSGFAELRHEVSDRWTLRGTGQYAYVARDDVYSYIGSQPITETNGRTNHIAYRGDNTQRLFSLDVNGVGSFPAFGREHTLVLGIDYQHQETTSAYVRLSNYGRIDVYNPVLPAEPPLDPYRDLPAYETDFGTRVTPVRGGSDAITDQFGIYGQARISAFEGFTLVLGGRLSWWDTQSVVTLPVPGRPTSYGFDNRFTPYAGFTYALTRDWSIYASYADSFQPQTSTGVRADGQAIEPLMGAQYEAGIKGSLFGDRLLLSAAIYQIDQSNRIQTDPDNANIIYQTGQVRSRGVEIEANGEILPGWRVNGGYAYNENKYAQDRANANLPFIAAVPKHSIKIFTNYAPTTGALRGLSIGAGVNYLSATEAGNRAVFNPDGSLRTRSTQLRQGGYAVVSARIGYAITEAISLSANLTNALDEKYYARIGGTGRGNFYGAPRSAFVTLRTTY